MFHYSGLNKGPSKDTSPQTLYVWTYLEEVSLQMELSWRAPDEIILD